MLPAEFKAMLDLLTMLFFDWRTGILLLLLTIAAISDCRTHRIPNWLVISGALFGVLYNTALSQQHNFIFAISGLVLGLLLFLPLYLVRAMGAGDVKLLAMVGSFLGPVATFQVALTSAIVGGVLSLILVVVRGTVPRLFHNLVALFQFGLLDVAGRSAPSLHISADASAGKLPYAVPIALGVLGYLVLHQLAYL